MGIDLSRFKVVHGDKVFNAIALMEVQMPENVEWDKRDIVLKPKFIDILAINEDGNIISIHDEAWTFQFIPIVGKKPGGSRIQNKWVRMSECFILT